MSLLFRYSIALLVMLPTAALADRIDGEWCSVDGSRHVKIDGPTIVTPGGQTIKGAYDRHAFSFTVPDGESDAGAKVDMRLMNETAVAVHFGDLPIETWNRCKPIA
jgi:hypothetical protein